jgi:hypothetical protein
MPFLSCSRERSLGREIRGTRSAEDTPTLAAAATMSHERTRDGGMFVLKSSRRITRGGGLCRVWGVCVACGAEVRREQGRGTGLSISESTPRSDIAILYRSPPLRSESLT